MSGEIALLGCVNVYWWRNVVRWGCFLQRWRPGKKATVAPLVLTWNNLFPFGLKLQRLGNKKGNRRRGRRFRRQRVSRIFWPCFSQCLSFSLLLWGVNTFQRMSSILLTGERASHALRLKGWKCVCCVMRHMRLLDTFFSASENLLMCKYRNWFSKGLWKTGPWIAFLTSYFARLWQIWRGGVVLIPVGEPIAHRHH